MTPPRFHVSIHIHYVQLSVCAPEAWGQRRGHLCGDASSLPQNQLGMAFKFEKFVSGPMGSPSAAIVIHARRIPTCKPVTARKQQPPIASSAHQEVSLANNVYVIKAQLTHLKDSRQGMFVLPFMTRLGIETTYPKPALINLPLPVGSNPIANCYKWPTSTTLKIYKRYISSYHQ
eukprot:jgi/Botrbrau1/14489/Bobra.0014s0123.1